MEHLPDANAPAPGLWRKIRADALTPPPPWVPGLGVHASACPQGKVIEGNSYFPRSRHASVTAWRIRAATSSGVPLESMTRTNGSSLQREEDLAAALEAVALFELVGGVAAVADALVGGVHVEIEDQQQIRDGGELLVEAADFRGIEAAGSLIGHGGEIIAVEDRPLCRRPARGRSFPPRAGGGR